MELYGLLGNPVGHSLSAPMHEAAYEACGMDARYQVFEPAPTALPAAVEGARALGIVGLNVTIPFKEDALEVVEPDPLAERIGAVNTIDLRGETLTGHNTDAAGVVRAFGHHDVPLGGQAVVVGAGGAGRAAAFALAEQGCTVAIANRTLERARRLAAEIPTASAHPLEAVAEPLAEADLLVNATSVGMEEDRSPVPAGALHGELAVLDAVYRPAETRLLRDAAALGAPTVEGSWMLLFQGAAAFERWTGRDPPIEAMGQALRAHL